MKKRIIILSTILIILSVLIIGVTNWNYYDIKSPTIKTLALENLNIEGPKFNMTPGLYYGIDARFTPVKKIDVHNATTIYDFLNDGEKQQIVHVNSVDVIVVKDNKLSQVRAYGTSDQLTDAQKEILKSTDYFSHFTIRTEFKGKNEETGKLEDLFFGPHITVSPDKQATYSKGKDALIEYLKINSRDCINVIQGDKLGAIKLSFIVSKEGAVKDVRHDAMSTGYPSIDKKLIELLEKIPGEWTPAENAERQKIDQELIFTFGPKDGC